MSVLEVCAIILALAMASIAVSAVVGLIRLTTLSRDAERALGRIETTLSAVDRMLSDSHEVIRDVRRVETRVRENMNILLDQVEPPIRTIAALIGATRSGLAAWLHNGHDRNARHAPSELERRSP